MTHEEKEKIKDLKKCNFKEIDLHFKRKSEERKAMSKDEKNVRFRTFVLPYLEIQITIDIRP